MFLNTQPTLRPFYSFLLLFWFIGRDDSRAQSLPSSIPRRLLLPPFPFICTILYMEHSFSVHKDWDLALIQTFQRSFLALHYSLTSITRLTRSFITLTCPHFQPHSLPHHLLPPSSLHGSHNSLWKCHVFYLLGLLFILIVLFSLPGTLCLLIASQLPKHS